MWGYLYGGYFIVKIFEEDFGVFFFGMISVFVFDWCFYDIMYIECFMKIFEDNEEGYVMIVVCNVEGFKNVVGIFFIFYGIGDDNVYYQNVVVLIDLFVGEGVFFEKMKIVIFMDSDYGFMYNGVSLWWYRFQMKQFWDEVQCDFEDKELVYQWSKKSFMV